MERWPADDRPRERLYASGPAALADAELVALQLGSGTRGKNALDVAREVLAAYGKALAAHGEFQEALSTIQRAQRADNPDWQLLSAEGGIRDSLGQHDQARALYTQALVLAPGEPQVLSNFGMSYVLTSELGEAEKLLRQAAASPKATLKVRENLALVLRLEGKTTEADQLVGAAGQVPPAAASPNGAAEENTWKALAQNG